MTRQFTLRALFLVTTFFAVLFFICRSLGFGQSLIPAAFFFVGTVFGTVVALRRQRTSVIIRGTIGGAVGGFCGPVLSWIPLCIIWLFIAPPTQPFAPPNNNFTYSEVFIGLGILSVFGAVGLIVGGAFGMILSALYVASFAPTCPIAIRLEELSDVRRGRDEQPATSAGE